MAITFFLVRERKVWVRTGTHTVIEDQEPDYARFAEDPDGTIQRVLRIWFAEGDRDTPFLRDYLGCVTLCRAGPSFRELHRLFRAASKAAESVGHVAKDARLELATLIRRRARDAAAG